jgi:hypothetical protein
MDHKTHKKTYKQYISQSVGSFHPVFIHMSLLQDQFAAYFHYKTCDVLTNGQYKRHLTLCKERGDNWAIELYNKQNKIHQCIKQVHARVNGISQTKVGMACKNVTNCAQPPIKIFMGFSTCSITGITSDKCLDLSKNGKKNQEIHIHPKFAYFFLFLWYVCKLEYVVRSCSKCWNEGSANEPDDAVCQQEYDEGDTDSVVDLRRHRAFMRQNQTLCDSLYQIFNRALAYVHASLNLYDREFMIQPILQPQEDFWDSFPENKKSRKSNGDS